MIQLQLTEEEQDILVHLLETCITDLRVEIHETDNYEYRNMLKTRKETLIKLQQALKSDQAIQAMT
mgnify:CR=1 FL=1